MSSAEVIERCTKCDKPIKMRVDIMGRVHDVPVVCECQKKEVEENGNKEREKS